MSVCDGSAVIGTCAPHANAHDVTALLQEFCKECYAEVPAGTIEANFCSVGFGGVADEDCDFLMIKRGMAPNEEYYIGDDCSNWYQITWEDNVGTVPNGTLPEDFIVTAWGTLAAMPDQNYAPVIFIIEQDCGIWIAVNDATNCDLGTVPATPGTGTSWIEITTLNIETRLKIAGLEVDIDGNTTGIIYPGACRDDTDSTEMGTAINLVFDCTILGAGGLDANDVALAATTWYYVYIIEGGAGTAAFLSTLAAPALPAGYTVKRRVGWARTDGSGAFYQSQMRDNVVMYVGITPYKTLLSLANISNVAWTLLSTPSYIPPTGRFGYFMAELTINTATARISWSIDAGANLQLPYLITGGDPINGSAVGLLPVDSSQQAWVLSSAAVDENLSLYLWAYKDDRWDVT